MKEGKAAARYVMRSTSPEKCGLCAHFIPGGHCQLVEGQISSQGWCRHFQRRKAA